MTEEEILKTAKSLSVEFMRHKILASGVYEILSDITPPKTLMLYKGDILEIPHVLYAKASLVIRTDNPP